jgi:ribosomal protein L7/L12
MTRIARRRSRSRDSSRRLHLEPMNHEPLPEPLASQIRAALSSGNAIEAIKLYRDFSHVGLAEAKAFIDRMAADPTMNPRAVAPGTAHPGVASALPEETARRVKAALDAGNKIEAIRIYRELSKTGLKEAHDFIEQLNATLRSGAPPVVKSGCGAMFLCGGMLGIAMLWAMLVLRQCA